MFNWIWPEQKYFDQAWNSYCSTMADYWIDARHLKKPVPIDNKPTVKGNPDNVIKLPSRGKKLDAPNGTA